MKLIYRIITLCILLIAICFAILNRSPVEVDLFAVTVELPLYIAVLGALGFGWLWGQFVVGFVAGKWRWRARSGERRAAKLANEVTTLREKADSAGEGGVGASEPRLRLADRSRSALNEP